MKFIVGIDEVGRGPLAGPVCVGVCAAPEGKTNKVWEVINGARDSKKLKAAQREFWYEEAKTLVLSGQLFYATSFVNNVTIDQRGITAAIRIAIKRALFKINLEPKKCKVLLDGGLIAPREYIAQETIIKGDDKEPIISLASIIAKVKRDRYMIKAAKKFPQYNFELHKGYGTKAHILALKKHGPCVLHRNSFLTGVLPIFGG